MSKHARKMNITLFAALAVFCLALFSTQLTSDGLSARYLTTSEGSDGARVARYAFDVQIGTGEQNFLLDLDQIKKPGDQQTCTFTVTNENENGVCEVAQKYTVYISELGSLPLQYNVTDRSNVVAGVTGSDEIEVYTGELIAGTPDSKEITLTVTWTVDETDLDFAGGVAALQIRIVAEQLD